MAGHPGRCSVDQAKHGGRGPQAVTQLSIRRNEVQFAAAAFPQCHRRGAAPARVRRSAAAGASWRTTHAACLGFSEPAESRPSVRQGRLAWCPRVCLCSALESCLACCSALGRRQAAEAAAATEPDCPLAHRLFTRQPRTQTGFRQARWVSRRSKRRGLIRRCGTVGRYGWPGRRSTSRHRAIDARRPCAPVEARSGAVAHGELSLRPAPSRAARLRGRRQAGHHVKRAVLCTGRVPPLEPPSTSRHRSSAAAACRRCRLSAGAGSRCWLQAACALFEPPPPVPTVCWTR